MFASKKAGNSPPQGKPGAREAPDSDDDDWLRVGRSFQGDASRETTVVSERALQVYSKRSKRSRERQGDRSSDSDSDRASRRVRKHGKDSKKSKKKKSRKKTKDRKQHTSRHRYRSDSESSSSSHRSSDSEYRRPTKRKRSGEDREAGHRRGTDSVVRSRRYEAEEATIELALLEDPTHGELEVYSHENQKEKLFEFDCAGDRENIVYGALYRHDHPRYHLATRRSIADGAWIVERSQRAFQHTPQYLDANRLDADRYFGRAAKMMEKRIGTKRLHLAYSQRRLARIERAKAREDTQKNEDEMTFIPLDAVVEGELDDVVTQDPNEVPNRSDDTSLPDGSSQSLWQTDLENVERHIVEQQKQLNERVAANAHDIDAWLDVIAFQDQTQHLSGERRQGDTDSIIEKQKAVLGKAIQKNADSRRLRQIQLNLSWREQQAMNTQFDSDSYRALVEQMLERDRTSPDLWVKLIQSAQAKFGTFSIPVLRDLYARVISVLNKELAEHLHSEESSASRSSCAFIRVTGPNSLLGSVDPYASVSINEKTVQLSESLLVFHRSLLRAELSAGYTERAVALGQALIEFNNIGRSNSSAIADTQHQQLLEIFSAQWNGQSEHFGQANGIDFDLAPTYLPSGEVLDAYSVQLDGHVVQDMEIPAAIRSPSHVADLVAPLGGSEGDQESDAESGTRSRNVAGAKLEEGGRWVYSNLHGQRIWIADIDESKEYERILDELRGSEKSRNRQHAEERKSQSKKSRRLDMLAKLRDERVDYAPINPDSDEHTAWLISETRAEVAQWEPLQPSNSDHTELIEMQPDRAILTEEILPFVFRLPRHFHFAAVMNLLDVLGLRQTSEKIDHPTHLLSSDDFDQFSLLTTPILTALNLYSPESITLSGHDRCNLLMKAIQQHIQVSPLGTVDRARVQVIRNVFAASLGYFTQQMDSAPRLLKAMWMQFELEVLLRVDEPDQASGSFRSFCLGLLSSSEESTSRPIDAWLMSVYASIELHLGNTRQMARICDKTVASLDLTDAIKRSRLCRAFHRLVFLRVYQELRAADGELGVLKAFYVLWRIWAPTSSDTLDSLVKTHRKNFGELETHLRTCLQHHRQEIVEKYRLELQIALDQCGAEKTSAPDCPSLSCSVAFALFNLCSALHASHGFHAAKQEFEYFLSDAAPTATLCHTRQCRYMLLLFLQLHQLSERAPSLPPKEWRGVVAGGVKAFPLDPLMLRLFVDAEKSNTMSQSLRKYFQSRRSEWQRSIDSPELVEWLFALLCEFARAERCGTKYVTVAGSSENADRGSCCVLHRWGKSRPAVDRIRRVFEEMVTQQKTSGAAIAWRLYVRFEIAMGKVEAARKVFYRGLAKCPWSKALYLDGLRVLRPYLSHDECQEISEFLVAKELHVRVDS